MNNMIKAADELADVADEYAEGNIMLERLDAAIHAYRTARNEQGEVKVKPLVWEHHPAGAIAAPPTGFAYILDTRGKHRVTSIKGFNPRREFDDLDAAKAAAQADYETRIRSALEE